MLLHFFDEYVHEYVSESQHLPFRPKMIIMQLSYTSTLYQFETGTSAAASAIIFFGISESRETV